MALRFPARVKARTSTTGTGTYTIDESVTTAGWRTPTRAVIDLDLADGDTFCYMVVDTTVTNAAKLCEVGTGTWNNTAKTVTRNTVFQPGGAAVSWGAGTRDFLIIDNPAIFLLLAGGTMTGVLNMVLAGTVIVPEAATGLLVQRSGLTSHDAGVSVISGTAGKSKINMGDDADEDAGGWYYNNNTNAMVCRTNGTDRQVIDSSGVLKTAVGGNSYDAFAAATGLPFYQAAAPGGWVKSTTHNDKALRVVSGTGGGSGGTRSLSTGRTEDHTLTIAQIPSHGHEVHYNVGASSVGASKDFVDNWDGSGGNVGTSNQGGDQPHYHNVSLAYIDVIICTKS